MLFKVLRTSVQCPMQGRYRSECRELRECRWVWRSIWKTNTTRGKFSMVDVRWITKWQYGMDSTLRHVEVAKSRVENDVSFYWYTRTVCSSKNLRVEMWQMAGNDKVAIWDGQHFTTRGGGGMVWFGIQSHVDIREWWEERVIRDVVNQPWLSS